MLSFLDEVGKVMIYSLSFLLISILALFDRILRISKLDNSLELLAMPLFFNSLSSIEQVKTESRIKHALVFTNELLFFKKASQFNTLITSYDVRSFTLEAEDPYLFSYIILLVLSNNKLRALDIFLRVLHLFPTN